jgi:H+/Cl- antiporter ClcA
VDPEREQAWLEKLSLRTQLIRLPLVLLTHLGGMSVGVESPSAALGAALLLALRRRWPAWTPLAGMPLPMVAAIGGGAGLGAAFRSPLLGITYGLEELGRRQGLPLVLPTLVIGGVGSLISTTLGQPARLPGLQLGGLEPRFWGWAVVLTLVGCALGSLFVRGLIPLAGWLQRQLGPGQGWPRRIGVVVGLALLLALSALASGGLSLNDGSLSLGAALKGEPGSLLTLLWRLLASWLSIAAGAPGGLMHDAMTLGALLVAPLQGLDARALAQLAAVGATAVFAAANGTPIFCAAFVFTLQGDPTSLPLLLLVSGVSAALAERWRGEEWNGHQANGLLR